MTDAKKHARPGSKWNSTARHPQKAFEQPKGFARGASVKHVPSRTDKQSTLQDKPK